MKVFSIILVFFIIQQYVEASKSNFPKPNYSNAIDAIKQPKYQIALKKMFPHIDYEQIVNLKQSKIVNGDVSNLGDFPYQVLHYMTDDGISWYTCGGSLITREWVLTAGHCVYEFIYFELYFGLIQRPPGNYTWATAVTGSQYIHLHEKYNDNTLSNDISLIFLSDAPSNLLEFSHIGIIPLPIQSDAEINLIGKIASVSGFGRTSDSGSASNVLRNTTAPIMSNAQCALTFGPYILNSNLCLDTNGTNAGSSCSGDSGGPVTAEIENRRVLVGVVSFGAAAGCTLGYPAVNTRVTSYIDWIDNIINSREPPNNENSISIAFCNARNSKIAGGEEAEIGEFPYHVHIMSNSRFFRLMCGGALIKPNWVLTAALCILEANDVTLYFGIVDRLSIDGFIIQVRNSDHFFLHPNYDGFNQDEPFNDNIGLIYLQGVDLLDFENVALISLPTNYISENFVGENAIATGFGATDDPPTSTSQYMKFVSMPIIENDDCNVAYNGSVNERKICTDTTGGRSTCFGDFGAPLIVERNNEKILIGIANLKYMGGCTVGQPGVFTRVTSYLDWIDDITNETFIPSPDDCVCDCICETCDAYHGRDEL
ncbi:hypothetical protein PVAND_017549 [Polypedilum vanderplanki]|uniref:Peptidase S1 domain-containing protein n=1 Tax=Polypedilum vanderplanki TaxID=319348 RepID=A0A9J6BIX7_POLVA|nr:hypothetical protein PVAND_017549 [Polypedilum vanderplanki]